MTFRGEPHASVDRGAGGKHGPARARIAFISGEAHTPGHIYRVKRYAEAAVTAGADVTVVRIEDATQHLNQSTPPIS